LQTSETSRLFASGPSPSVLYIQPGAIKLTITWSGGKEAVSALLYAGDFVGEGCIAGQPFRELMNFICNATAKMAKSLRIGSSQKKNRSKIILGQAEDRIHGQIQTSTPHGR
jgi:CRP-like cAMP-binding protein